MRSQNPEIDTCTGDISAYQGPAQDFPFKAVRLLGAAQLIVALLLEAAAIVQLSLSEEDRYVFVASACVGAWAPLAGIAAGVIGVSIDAERYWETRCMKYTFLVLTAVNASVFMPALVLIVSMVTSAYYGVTEAIDEDHLLPIPTAFSKDDTEDREYLVGAVVALGLLQIAICICALVCITCCAPLYQLRERALKRKLYGAHNPRQVKNKQMEALGSSRQQLIQREPRYTVAPQPTLNIGPALQPFEAQLYDVTMATIQSQAGGVTPEQSMVYIVEQ